MIGYPPVNAFYAVSNHGYPTPYNYPAAHSFPTMYHLYPVAYGHPVAHTYPVPYAHPTNNFPSSQPMLNYSQNPSSTIIAPYQYLPPPF